MVVSDLVVVLRPESFRAALRHATTSEPRELRPTEMLMQLATLGRDARLPRLVTQRTSCACTDAPVSPSSARQADGTASGAAEGPVVLVLTEGLGAGADRAASRQRTMLEPMVFNPTVTPTQLATLDCRSRSPRLPMHEPSCVVTPKPVSPFSAMHSWGIRVVEVGTLVGTVVRVIPITLDVG